MSLGLVLRLAVAASLLQSATAKDVRPFPDANVFFEAVRANLARSQDDQKLFAYKERRTELNLNPFGRLGTGGSRVREVTPVEDGNAVTIRVIERDGKPVTDSEAVRRPMRMSARGRRVVDDVAATLDISMSRREHLNGRDAIVAVFKARPDAKPQTREGRIARDFAGEIWIDELTREVTRIDAKAIDDVAFGYGVLARLNKGATVTLRRELVHGNLWLPVSMRFSGEGRALLLRKLTIDFAVDWFDYRRVL
ncbi:MAG TPA: hypothetical protein VFU28_02240 [Vicinamibacterales bacterium]|nr:hypothetical protein [Vicinamibacterales bacterium]